MSITTRTVYVVRCDECGTLMSDEGAECLCGQLAYRPPRDTRKPQRRLM